MRIHGWLLVVVLLAVPLAMADAAEKPAAAPSGASQAAGTKALDAAACRTKALAAEKAKDWPGALAAWERVMDRCVATQEQRVEARVHVKELRPKVPRNTDPRKARPWKVLAVIFRRLDFSWKDGDKTIEAHKVVSPADEKKIRASIEGFRKFVFDLSSGMLRIDADVVVVDKPLTALDKDGESAFCPAPHITRPFTDPLIKGKAYDTVFCYVKFNGDPPPDVPAPWIAATYASASEVDGAGYISVPWHTNFPLPGEPAGEMELHEWLHQVDSMFEGVLHYPDDVVPSSDTGRHEGENREGGDPEYARTPKETTWMRFYKHIMEDHVTRQMWSEATMRPSPGQALPGDCLRQSK